MLGSEIRAIGRVGGQVVGWPATAARDVHGAVAARVFDSLGILGAPVRVVHDGLSRSAYRAVGAVLEAPLNGLAGSLARAHANGVSVADAPRARLAIGALNGAVGDALAREHPALALSLSLRRHGHDIATDPDSLATAYPEATARVAVFVHGLCETEDAWHMVPLRGGSEQRRSYGARLREELGFTPLYVRYNTGLRVSDNGRRLAAVLEDVSSAWPVPLREIVLIGHSMGGLVARSACHYGDQADHEWTSSLRHVFCLGTPHLGAPLEKAANVAGWALARVPEIRPLAKLVNGRSVGIKDLRFGNCVEEDWCDCEPDEFLRDRCREVPFLATATYYFVGATLARDTDSRAGGVLGDLLVRMPSASGAGQRRRIPFEIDNGLRIGGVNHFQLLNHPAVYEQIRLWIERGGVQLQLPAAQGE